MVRNGRETQPAHGVKRQGPNGFPPTSIMTDLSDTGDLCAIYPSRRGAIRLMAANGWKRPSRPWRSRAIATQDGLFAAS
jgi:hypothetical protein